LIVNQLYVLEADPCEKMQKTTGIYLRFEPRPRAYLTWGWR